MVLHCIITKVQLCTLSKIILKKVFIFIVQITFALFATVRTRWLSMPRMTSVSNQWWRQQLNSNSAERNETDVTLSDTSRNGCPAHIPDYAISKTDRNWNRTLWNRNFNFFGRQRFRNPELPRTKPKVDSLHCPFQTSSLQVVEPMDLKLVPKQAMKDNMSEATTQAVEAVHLWVVIDSHQLH